MRLYIIRHADPDYKNNTITEVGHKEAKALAKRLAMHGLDKIYSSPLGRAIDTAKYTAELIDLEYNIEEWTKELWAEFSLRDTPWGKKIVASGVPGEVYRSGEILPTHQTWHQCSFFENTQAKENFEIVKKNSDAFLLRHGYERVGGRYRCVQPNREQIAVFCHGVFGLTWLAHLLEVPLTLMWAGFRLSPSSVTTILFEERDSEWAVPRCIGLADVSHLYEAGLLDKPEGVKAEFYI